MNRRHMLEGVGQCEPAGISVCERVRKVDVLLGEGALEGGTLVGGARRLVQRAPVLSRERVEPPQHLPRRPHVEGVVVPLVCVLSL